MMSKRINRFAIRTLCFLRAVYATNSAPSKAPISQVSWLRSSRVAKEKCRESSALLRRPGHAAAGILRNRSQANGSYRLPSRNVARHEVLRAFRAQGFYPLPGSPRGLHQELFLELR